MTVTIRGTWSTWAIVATVGAVLVALSITQPWQARAAPGDTDATYNPTAGCRLTDTRLDTNVGPRSSSLGAGEVFEVMVHGSNGECTGPLAIPGDAVAVALNVTVVNATTASNVRVYPADLTAVPLLSNVNVTAGGPPTPNKVDVKLSPDGKIKVFNFRGSVDIVMDLNGFYTSASLQQLASQGGPVGPQGPRGLSAWDTIPSGVTVTGVESWNFDQSVADNSPHVFSVSFPGVAPSAPTAVNFAPALGVGDGDVTCTGTGDAPTAPPGQVCAYIIARSNVDTINALPLIFSSFTETKGFAVRFNTSALGVDYFIGFTWAYTAP